MLKYASWLVMLAGCLSAADLTWDGAADNLWSGANWGGKSWVAGSRAVFSSAADVTVSAATGQVGGFLFNDNVSLTGSGTITLSSSAVSVAAGKTAHIDAPLAGTAGLTKSGTGTLEVTQPNFSGILYVNEGKAQLTIAEGRTYALNVSNGNQLTGNVAFTGPGRLDLSKRIYPNGSGSYTFDGGITFSVTTHNAVDNGLMVSGNKNCLVNLGDCTVINSKAGSTICLTRCITLNLTDTEKGTTISTRNTSDDPIEITTARGDTTFKGAGRLNLTGGGAFRFDSTATFSNTGLITVSDDTHATLNTTVAGAPFRIADGGTLTCAAYIPAKKVTVATGGTLDLGTNTGSKSFANGLAFEDGSTLKFTVGLSLAQGDAAAFNKGLSISIPTDGGCVTLDPVAPTAGLTAGRYPVFTNAGSFSTRSFTLAQTTLGSFNLGLEKDGTSIVLVVSADACPGWCTWSGANGADWSGLSWDGGAAFVAGAGALFATANAEATVDAATPSVRALAFTENATLTGTGTLALTSSEVTVAADKTATITAPVTTADGTFAKYGAGRLVLDASKLASPIRAASYEGILELNLPAGASTTFARTGDDCMRSGGVAFTGPGTFTTDRQYPRNWGSTNIIDGGATVILTSLYGANDGLMVSGGLDGESIGRFGTMVLGNCTIKSGYDTETLLQRSVNLLLSDVEHGATIWTEGPSGTPITIKTYSAGRFFGDGTLNVDGTGTFIFSGQATFSMSGKVNVRTGATAQFNNNVPATFYVESGARLLFSNAIDTLGALNFADGAIFAVALNASEQGGCVATRGVTWPATGTVTLRISGQARLANGTYTLLGNAGADALAHITPDITIPGKAVELVVENGDLKAVVTTGAAPELTWKGGAGAWSDADGWNDDAWIDAAHAIFPLAGGAVTLEDSVTLGGLSVLGTTSITGSGAFTFAPSNDLARVEADLTVEPTFTLASGTLVKTGAGKLTFTGEPQTSGATLDIRAGEVAYTQPANGFSKIKLADDTAVDLGGGSLAMNLINWSTGTNTFKNGTLTGLTENMFRTSAEGQTWIFDDGANLDTTVGRFWVYNGGHVILGPNCGRLAFQRSDRSSYVGATDGGKCDRLTIQGGELFINATAEYSFGIGARPDAGVTGIVHVVGGAFTVTNASLVLARHWSDDFYPCLSHGELILDGGTLTTTALRVGATKGMNNAPHTGDAVLRFNGGTAVLGAFQLCRFVDRDILFNGTVFKPIASRADFMTQVDCESGTRSVLAIGAGNFIVDTDGFAVGSSFAPTGSGALVKRGAGTLTLQVPQVYTGTTTVEGGTLACATGRFPFPGGCAVAAGATLDVGTAQVSFGGTLALADGASLALTLTSGTCGSLVPSAVTQAGALTLAVTAPADWSGVATLLADVSAMNLEQITVTGLPEGVTTRVIGTRLVACRSDALVWKGGVGAWGDADGWNDGAWVTGATALFLDAAGSTVTLNEAAQVASLGCCENTTLVAGTADATLTLAANALDVPAGRTLTVGPTLVAAGLAKTGAGTLVLGGAQPSLGSLAIADGTVQVTGAVSALATLTAQEGTTLAFGPGASLAVTGAVTLPSGTLSCAADAGATLTAGTYTIGPDFVLPAGLTLDAGTIPALTVTNNVMGLTVNGTLIDRDTLTVGYVNDYTGTQVGDGDGCTWTYEIAGSGTLRVKEMRMRSSSRQHFTVRRLEIMGTHLFAQGNAASINNCLGTFAFDGTTIAPYGTDVGMDGAANNAKDVTLRVGSAGVTFDTCDAADGTTGRTIAFYNPELTFAGEGPLTKTGAGTLILGVPHAYTGETRVSGGTLKVLSTTATSRYVVQGAGSTLQVAGIGDTLPSTLLGEGTKLVLGDGTRQTELTGTTISFGTGTALEVIGSAAAGVPFLDLAQATVTLPAEGTVAVDVKIASALPDGEYPILKLATLDDATYAKYSVTVTDEAATGATYEVLRRDALGMITVRVGGSSAHVTANRWIGRGATGNWSEALNWRAGSVPDETTALIFAGTGNLTNVNNVGASAFPALGFMEDAGAFDIDLAGVNIGVITNSVPQDGAVQKVRNLTTTKSSFQVWGTGTTWLVDPTFAGVVSQPQELGENLLVIELSEGTERTFNSLDHSWNGGPRRFTGAGTLTMDRVYPNKLTAPVTFDGGITAWVTTHNGAANGLLVSGLQTAEVRLGACTIGTTFSTATELARWVTVKFTDATEGATIQTDNKSGTPISILTTGSSGGGVTLAGEGALNIDGHGTFTFNKSSTKFTYSGATRVWSTATATLQAGAAIPNSPFAVAGKLVLAAGSTLGQPMALTGTLALEGQPTMAGLTCAANATIQIAVPEDWANCPKVGGPVVGPATGTTKIVLDCTTRPEPNIVYPITQGAKLTTADLAKFTITTTQNGVNNNFGYLAQPRLVNGELGVIFRRYLIIYLR